MAPNGVWGCVSKTTSSHTFLLLDEGREEVSGVGAELMVVEGVDEW